MLPSQAGSEAAPVGPSGLDLPAGVATPQPERPVRAPANPVPTSPDIQALTRAVRRGNAEAFSRFYDLYSFRLYKFLLVLARGDETLARELSQSVFIKLARRCEVFKDEQRLWAWLCVLAKNTFIDHWRSRQRLNRFVPLEELPAEGDEPPHPEHRLGEILRETLAALPSEERELLQAAYVDKWPLQQLADEAGQSYKAIESRLGRLRQKLKAQLLKHLRHENRS